MALSLMRVYTEWQYFVEAFQHFLPRLFHTFAAHQVIGSIWLTVTLS